MALHWYTPMLPVATRRERWGRRWPLWLGAAGFVGGMTLSAWVAWRRPWRALEAKYVIQDALRLITPTRYAGRWLNPLTWGQQLRRTIGGLWWGVKLTFRPLPWWRKCWWHVCWFVTATSSAVCLWALNPHVPEPMEPDGPGQPAMMVEVTQQEALEQPTHFVCPAGLRALVTEKIMLLERTPTMVQKIKSMAGKWCDDHQVGPFERPRYIAGAVAAAMTVPHLEMDLLLFNAWDPIQRAHRKVRQYHGETINLDATSRFWQWMRQGRR